MQDYGKRIPVDPRVVERIERSPRMMSEQGSSFMATWGGPQRYKRAAKLPVNQRRVYYAVEGGLQTSEEISIATDLSVDAVDSSLAQLAKKGWISLEATPKEV